MKKVISLLFTLLLVLTVAVGCRQNEKSTEISENETVADKTTENTTNNNDTTVNNANNDETMKNTTNNNESKDSKNNEQNTDMFAVPQETDDYRIENSSDPEKVQTLEQHTDSKMFGMDGYLIEGEETKEGEYAAGSSFFIYAKDKKALLIKGIIYLDENYLIFLEEVNKGTPQSQEILSITVKKPFKGQFVKFEDGTDMRNITLLDKEVGLERVTGGEFQQADLNNNTIDIISPGSTTATTYIIDGVTPESLEWLQKGEKIEYMRGIKNNTVYAVRSAGK